MATQTEARSISPRSAIMMEREFFRAFFAALVESGTTSMGWRMDETAARFQRVYEYLRQQQHQNAALKPLVRRLRPDPITGANPALDSALMNLQPTDLTAPNPSYERVLFTVSPNTARQIVESLPAEFRPAVRGAAKVFAQSPQ